MLEFTIGVMVVGVIVTSFFVTIAAMVVAGSRSQWGWVIAIFVSCFTMLLAPIVAMTYLVVQRRRHRVDPADVPAVHDAGWYADPGGTFDARYWDGSQWTEQVMDSGIARSRPLP